MDRYGIIQKDSIYVPGDERSRTHPGHGYPGGYQSIIRLREFTDKDEWEKAIDKLANPSYGSPKQFRAVILREVEVTTETKINL